MRIFLSIIMPFLMGLVNLPAVLKGNIFSTVAMGICFGLGIAGIIIVSIRS